MLTQTAEWIKVFFKVFQESRRGRPMSRLASGIGGIRLILILIFILTAASSFGSAAVFARPQRPDVNEGSFGVEETPVWLQINVRETNGMPLTSPATVRLQSSVHAINLVSKTEGGSAVSFQNILPGDYEIEVISPGYKTTIQHASVIGGSTVFPLYIYVHSDSEGPPRMASSQPAPVSVKLQEQIDKGLQRMRKKKYDDALRVFGKAEKMSPANPDVQYLLGMAHYELQQMDAAQTSFEAALKINPWHERALVALGQLQMQTAKPTAAIETLKQSYERNGADSRTLLLLAQAYFETKDYRNAEIYASRASEMEGGKYPAAQALLAKIQSSRGQVSGGATSTQAQDLSRHSGEATANDQLGEPNQPAADPGKTDEVGPGLSPATPEMLANVRPWAPPDVDSKEYAVASDVACSLPEVLQRAQVRMKQQLSNFEKFTATEHIVHVEINKNGIPGTPREKDFYYLVDIFRPGNGYTYLEESRDGGENLNQFPTSLATKGLISIGVALLDPNYEGDFDYRCEGLANWHDQPAWELRFEQKQDVPSRVLIWRKFTKSFPIALRGRIWVGANNYDLLHLEMDLREPVPQLEIDYGPVQFDHGRKQLWLPWRADAYIGLHGKRYHHSHTLSNYTLFSVDTDNKIAAPKLPANNN